MRWSGGGPRRGRRHDQDVQLESAIILLKRTLEELPELRGHIADQKRAIDGWSSPGEVSVQRSPEASSTEAAAAARWQWDLELADVDAGVRAVIAIASDVWSNVQRLLGLRSPLTAKCVGLREPLSKENTRCDNLASEHRDPVDKTTISELCDQCWVRACPRCHARPAEERRKITIDGRLVAGCESCYRTERRQAGRTTSDDELLEMADPGSPDIEGATS